MGEVVESMASLLACSWMRSTICAISALGSVL
jgi:hypothetical protein